MVVLKRIFAIELNEKQRRERHLTFFDVAFFRKQQLNIIKKIQLKNTNIDVPLSVFLSKGFTKRTLFFLKE